MAVGGMGPVNRRVAIVAAAGAAALAVQAAASLAPTPVEAADGDGMKVGATNDGTASTWVSTPAASPALGGRSGDGDGVTGSSSGDLKSGVYGTSEHERGYGVFGRNLKTHAFGSLGGPEAGVAGSWGPDGGTEGALGLPKMGAHAANMVTGTAADLGSEGAGVVAHGSSIRPALIVDGVALLSRVGVAVVAKGRSSVQVKGWKSPIPEMGLAALQAYRAGVSVAATVVDSGAGTVTIHLTKKVTANTRVAYVLFAAPVAL